MATARAKRGSLHPAIGVMHARHHTKFLPCAIDENKINTHTSERRLRGVNNRSTFRSTALHCTACAQKQKTRKKKEETTPRPGPARPSLGVEETRHKKKIEKACQVPKARVYGLKQGISIGGQTGVFFALHARRETSLAQNKPRLFPPAAATQSSARRVAS